MTMSGCDNSLLPPSRRKATVLLLAGFLLFTLLFYGYRYPMKWGNPATCDTTVYKTDAPSWVRAMKDVAMLGFVAASVVVAGIRPARRPPWVMLALAACAALHCGYMLWRAAQGMNAFQALNNGMRLLWEPALVLAPLLLWDAHRDVLKLLVPLALAAVALMLAWDAWMMWGYYANGIMPGVSHALRVRFGGVWNDPNAAGLLLAACAVGMVGCPAASRGRWVLAACGLLAAAGVVLTLSRSAFLAMVAGAILYAVLLVVLGWRRPQVRRQLAVLLAAGVLAGLLLAFWQPAHERLLQLTNYDDPYRAGQLAAVRAAATAPAEEGWIHNENFYAGMYVNTGPLVTVLFAAVQVAALAMAAAAVWRNRRGEPWAPSLALVLMCMFLAVNLLVPMFLVYPVNVYYWVLFYLVVRWPAAAPSAARADEALVAAA